MSEMQKKTKVIILVGLVILFFPTFAISEFGMTFWKKKFQEKDGDPRTPARLLMLAHIYHHTYREEKYRELLLEWIDRYGGDETDHPNGERYISWETAKWSEEHPRPATWKKDPDKLTGEALCDLAEHYETSHQYQLSKHLFDLIVNSKTLNPDAESVARAQKGLLRNTTRSSF